MYFCVFINVLNYLPTTKIKYVLVCTENIDTTNDNTN